VSGDDTLRADGLTTLRSPLTRCAVSRTRTGVRVREDLDRRPAAVLSAPSPGARTLRRDDDDFVVFCFGKLEDAQIFAERFDGERLSVTQRR